MTSVIVPPVDLAPGMPSRVVTISATDVTEGGKSLAGQTVTFALSDTLDVTSGGDVIAKTEATITLDSNGDGRIRLPVYNADVKNWCGDSDWAVLVSASWGSRKAIRVPSGTSTIALSDLPPVRPLRGREKQWAVTGAGITIVEGAQWGASVELQGGVLRFVLTVPPGGTSWYKGALGSTANLDTLADGAYVVVSGDVAEAIGLPEPLNGVVESYDWPGLQRYHVKTTSEQRTWQRSRFAGWQEWQRTDGNAWFRGNLDEQDATTLADLRPGLYLVRYVGTAEAFDLPQRMIGQLEVVDADSQRQIFWRPNDAGAGWGTKIEWVLATNSSGELRDRWQRLDKSIMRTAPVVLTSPAGDYPQADSRGAVRLPFTVPTTIGRVRVHMRPWNFRTREEWGPAKMSGVMIAQQNSDDSGTITGSRWYAPNVDGQTVTGSEEWVSDWFYVGLTPGNTYLLSYAAEWQDTSRNLVSGQCWSNFDLDKWDTTEPANYQNGWGGFTLNPMDVWIECEAPSDVPVWGYFESSNGVFAGARSVFGAYPNVHARKNGAFAAVTAAGGWSPMDETFHDAAIIERFGYPARILDRMYLGMGANIEIRDATAAEAIVELDRWMNVRTPALGNPPIYLLTQISRYTSEETKDTAGTLSDWNEWIRYEATQRNDVAGLIDQAAIFQDPEKPWTARVELRNSPTDVHFGPMGQKLRAAALDGEVHLPLLTQKNEDDLPWRSGFQWTGEPNASESVMTVGGREERRNLYHDPKLTDPSVWATADILEGMEWDSSWSGNSNPSGFAMSLLEGSVHAGPSTAYRTNVSPGEVLTLGVNVATPAGFQLRARIYWYDSSGDFITSENAPNQPSSGEKVFTRVVVTGTAPAGAATACPYFWLYEGTSNPTSPDAIGYLDGITFERGVTDGSYFDGDTEGWDRLDRLENPPEVESVEVPLEDGIGGSIQMAYSGGWVFLNGREIDCPNGNEIIAILPESARPAYTPLYGLTGRTGAGEFAHYSITTPGGAITLRQGSSYTTASYFTLSWPQRNPSSI